MMISTDAQFSTAALVLGLAVAGLMYWMEKRPRKDLRPRLFPTTLVLFLGMMLALGAGFHLLGLAGLKPPPH